MTELERDWRARGTLTPEAEEFFRWYEAEGQHLPHPNPKEEQKEDKTKYHLLFLEDYPCLGDIVSVRLTPLRSPRKHN